MGRYALPIIAIGVLFAGTSGDYHWPRESNYVSVGDSGYINYRTNSHGYRIRPVPVYTPPVYTFSYFALGADGSYTLVTSTTTGNPEELKNQKITDAYNQKKAQELAKIAGIISQYNVDRQTVLDEFDLETAIPYWASHGYITTGASGGDMDPEELAKFLNNLYKSSVKRIKSAKKAYNDGDLVKAAKDITIGTGGFTVWGITLFSIIIYETYGPIYQQKQELNKTSNKTSNK